MFAFQINRKLKEIPEIYLAIKYIKIKIQMPILCISQCKSLFERRIIEIIEKLVLREFQKNNQ